jgi:hypothetical protein
VSRKGQGPDRHAHIYVVNPSASRSWYVWAGHGHGFSDVWSLRCGKGALEHGTRSQSRMGNSFGPQGSQDRLRDYRVSLACKSCLIKRCPGSQASKPTFPVVCPGKRAYDSPCFVTQLMRLQLLPAAFFDPLGVAYGTTSRLCKRGTPIPAETVLYSL